MNEQDASMMQQLSHCEPSSEMLTIVLNKSTLSMSNAASSPSYLPSTSYLANYSPTPLIALLLIGPLLLRLYLSILADYRFFLSLGPGGTPQTPIGYARLCLLRLIARRDVFTPPRPITSYPFHPYFGNSHTLAQRQSDRPKVAGLAPQRQLTQRGTNEDVQRLSVAMRALAASNPDFVQTGISCFEKFSLALFMSRTLANVSTVVDKKNRKCEVIRNATCGMPPEIAHMHGSEGSLHLTLHPEDAAVVIKRGWGERHPLSGRWSVPRGFVMVYAPKTEEELNAVMAIIRAGCWWVGSVELRDPTDGDEVSSE